MAAIYIFATYARAADGTSGAAGATGTTVIASCVLYPLVVSAVGILTGLMTMAVAKLRPEVERNEDVESRLKFVLVLCTVFQSLAVLLVGFFFLPPVFQLTSLVGGAAASSHVQTVTSLQVSICTLTGLWAGLFIGVITEYYTSHSYHPVRETAEAYRRSASTGLILGYALGFKSCVVPLVLIAATIAVSMQLAGPFGIAMAGIGRGFFFLVWMGKGMIG